MASNVINGHELQAHLISVQEKKKIPNGSENAYVSYNGKPGKFYIQTPVMRLPFGVSPPGVTATGVEIKKYSAQLSFDGMDKDAKIKAFYDALVALDEHMIELGIQNSVAWFGGKKSREVVVEKYQPIIKPAKKADYAPTFKLNIREVPKGYRKGANGKQEADPDAGTKLEPVLYDLEDNRLDYGDFDICNAVPRGSLAKVRIDVGGVWFSNVGYGLSLRFSMARVKPSAVVQGPPPGDKDEFTAAESYAPAETTEDATGDGSGSEAHVEETPAPAPTPAKSAPKVVARKPAAKAPTPPPEDSDDDDAPAEEPPAPVVVAKKPVAKIVKKAGK